MSDALQQLRTEDYPDHLRDIAQWLEGRGGRLHGNFLRLVAIEMEMLMGRISELEHEAYLRKWGYRK